METDLKVLVFRDRDKKKNVKEKRSLLSRFPMGNRGIAIMAAVVVLIAAAACSDLFGFGSGNPKPDRNYNEGIAMTWNGRAQLVLKKTGDEDFTVNVK